MDEDHHHHLQQQHQYNESVILPDLGMAPTPFYHTTSMHQGKMSDARNPNSAAHHFDMLVMAHQNQNYQQQLMQDTDHHQLQTQHQEMMMHNNNTCSSTSGGVAMESTSEANVCSGGAGRWPRQETLTLLEIRSRIDHKFKESNQKGPLWDEISRIMSDEHGYIRSGKKCREKFENLYKYYKKTKEGKAGRQDGKHYRFFRQLEALYGETKTSSDTSLLPLQEVSHFSEQIPFDALKKTSCSNPTNTLQLGSNVNNLIGSLSLSCNSSDFSTSSSEDNVDSNGNSVRENGCSENKGIKKRRGRRNWREKIKEFIDTQMRSLIEMQEVWLAKFMKTVEQTEQDRVLREEEWTKREEERMERERKLWTSERQWIESRDANLMEVFSKLKGHEILEAFNNNQVIFRAHNEIDHNIQWEESEITKLVQLRASLEPKFEQICRESKWGQAFVLWEEIATRMASLGSNKSSLMCKNKWESINNYLVSNNKNDFAYKKQKGDNSRISSSFYHGAGTISQVEGCPVFGRSDFVQTHKYYNISASETNSAVNNNVQQQDQSFFRFMVDHEGGIESLWGNNNNL